MGHFKCLVPLAVLFLATGTYARPGSISNLKEGHQGRSLLDPLGLFKKDQTGSSSQSSSQSSSYSGGLNLGLIGISGSVSSSKAEASSKVGASSLGGGAGASAAGGSPGFYGAVPQYGGSLAQAQASSGVAGGPGFYGSGLSGANAQAQAQAQAGSQAQYLSNPFLSGNPIRSDAIGSSSFSSSGNIASAAAFANAGTASNSGFSNYAQIQPASPIVNEANAIYVTNVASNTGIPNYAQTSQFGNEASLNSVANSAGSGISNYGQLSPSRIEANTASLSNSGSNYGSSNYGQTVGSEANLAALNNAAANTDMSNAAQISHNPSIQSESVIDSFATVNANGPTHYAHVSHTSSVKDNGNIGDAANSATDSASLNAAKLSQASQMANQGNSVASLNTASNSDSSNYGKIVPGSTSGSAINIPTVLSESSGSASTNAAANSGLPIFAQRPTEIGNIASGAIASANSGVSNSDSFNYDRTTSLSSAIGNNANAAANTYTQNAPIPLDVRVQEVGNVANAISTANSVNNLGVSKLEPIVPIPIDSLPISTDTRGESNIAASISSVTNSGEASFSQAQKESFAATSSNAALQSGASTYTPIQPILPVSAPAISGSFAPIAQSSTSIVNEANSALSSNAAGTSNYGTISYTSPISTNEASAAAFANVANSGIANFASLTPGNQAFAAVNSAAPISSLGIYQSGSTGGSNLIQSSAGSLANLNAQLGAVSALSSGNSGLLNNIGNLGAFSSSNAAGGSNLNTGFFKVPNVLSGGSSSAASFGFSASKSQSSSSQSSSSQSSSSHSSTGATLYG